MINKNYQDPENSYNYNDSEDIDLSRIFNTLQRNKKFIALITFLVTILNILFTYIQKPVYRGSFRVLASNNEFNQSSNSLLGNPLLTGLQMSLDNKTQEFILNSPYVLFPVFEKAKENYLSRGEEVEELDFLDWTQEKLYIKFEPRTNILTVKYVDIDKNNILNILEMISTKYQDYSKKDREKTLTNAILHLEEQKIIYMDRTKKSLKELNKFSIENGLGDIDGFVSLDVGLGGSKINLSQFNNSTNLDLSQFGNSNNVIPNFNNLNSKEDKAGQRFQNQFSQLEKYEATYTNLSSKLKSNSILLGNLKTRIDNLRNSLKRPNEILVKYREYTTAVRRDENLLNNIEEQLSFFKLEKAKQRDTWDLISEPAIEKGRVSPKRKQSTIIAFILSFVFSSLLFLFKEKKSKIIYEKKDLKNIILCNYLDTISSYDISLSNKIIISQVNKYNLKDKIGVMFIKNKNLGPNKTDLSNLFMKDINGFEKAIYPEDLDSNKFKKYILLISEGELKYDDVFILNKYLKIYEEKIIGWYFVGEFKN